MTRVHLIFGAILGGLCASCVTSNSGQRIESPKQVRHVYTIDAGRLFEIAWSRTLTDFETLDKQVMKRVMLMPPLLENKKEKDRTIKRWIERIVLHELGRRGTSVIAFPAFGEKYNYTPVPTAALRESSIFAAHDEFTIQVIVTADKLVKLDFSQGPEKSSLCPKKFTLPLGYVKMNGYIHRIDDGRVISWLDEIRFIGPMKKTKIDLDLPSHETFTAEFCRELREKTIKSKLISRTDVLFEKAAQKMIADILTPLYDVPKKTD